MIPDFALLLSEESIILLHRVSGCDGWANVDEISLEMDDLPTGMRQLCDTAHRLAEGVFSTKLLLPKSQLLYAEIAVDKDADADIRAALEDRTPYTADQLIYDSSGTGPMRHVVAVARETLDEASGFIAQFGFNPTGFSTIPPKGHFDGEPNLGDFKGATFVPDVTAVAVIETTDLPVADTPSAAPEPTEISELKPDTEPDPKPLPDPTPVVENPSPREPAAFSSRRHSSEVDADLTSARLIKRAPRIAIPDKNVKADAPKVQIPLRHESSPASRVKAPSASRPVPPIIPPAMPDQAKLKSTEKLPKSRAKAAATAPTSTKADPLAAFAARQSASNPRVIGLAFTAVIVVALLVFVALSSYLSPDGALSKWLDDDTDAPVEIVDAPASAPEEFDTANLPAEINLPGAQPSFEDLPPDQELSVISEAPNPDPVIPVEEPNAETIYAATGIWQRAPVFGKAAKPDTLDDLYVASLDPNPVFKGAPTLPVQNATSGDTRPAIPKAPPPPGVRYDLDARGLVRAVPDGALSPEGVMVFAGRPPIAPVRRDNSLIPNGLAPAILDPTETVPEPQPEIAQGTAVPAPTPPAQAELFADPALARFTPRPRPADLSDLVERARLGGLTRAELAQRRPDARPQAVIEQAQTITAARAAAAQIQAQAQAQAIQDALAEAETDAAAQERAASLIPLENGSTAATELAIATSRKPPPRPNGFENIVRSARRAPQQTQPQVQTASAARATGPAVARSSRVRPSGPTAGTVARAATDNNAISLGQVALVGVFGTSSSRRALVRLPSGRFKKVSIGDRVDGGRVAAIGASELKYTKSGRTLTLKMPKG